MVGVKGIKDFWDFLGVEDEEEVIDVFFKEYDVIGEGRKDGIEEVIQGNIGYVRSQVVTHSQTIDLVIVTALEKEVTGGTAKGEGF